MHSKIFLSAITTWLILAFSLLFSGLVWYWTDQLVLQRANDRFAFQSQEIKQNIIDRMDDYQSILRGGVALFKASKSVEHHEWKSYVEGLNIQKYFPGIQGLGFAQVITPGALARHEALIRSQGVADYRGTTLDRRPLNTAIIYLEPLDWRNQRAIGYDMFSEPVRREAMERARDTGDASLSGKVTLVQETNHNVQNGFLIYQPVYRQGASVTSVEERRAALEGYVYSPFRIDDLMQGLLRSSLTYVDFHLYDTAKPSPASLLYAYKSKEDHFAYPATTALYDKTLELDIDGRVWTLYVHTLPGYIPAAEANLPIALGTVSVAFSILLFFYLRSLSHQYQQSLQLTNKIASELHNSEEGAHALLEYAPDTVIVIDESGIIQTCNPAGEQLSGWQADEIIGKNVNSLIPSPHREAHDSYLARYLESGEGHIIGIGRDVELLHKDGTLIPVNLRIGVQRMSNGQCRFIGFLRDLTERVKIDKALKDRDLLFTSMINASTDGLLIADQTGKLLEANDAYCKYSGYSHEALLKMNIRDLESIESSDKVSLHMEIVNGKGSDLFEANHRAQDGHLLDFEVSMTYTNQTEQPRYLSFYRDITDRKRYQDNLSNQNLKLEALVDARTTELQQQAAELRTQYAFLEKANRIMVGRELDMIALKQQVNELAVQLGEPARYNLSFLDKTDI